MFALVSKCNNSNEKVSFENCKPSELGQFELRHECVSMCYWRQVKSDLLSGAAVANIGRKVSGS